MSTPRLPAARSRTRQISARPYSERRPGTAISTNRSIVVPLALEAITKFEEASKNNVSTVSRLEKDTSLSTPRSIKQFIYEQSIGPNEVFAAKIIQKNWRIYLGKKKIKFFLEFIRKLRKRELKYSIARWRLALMPVGGEARKRYNDVVNYLIYKGSLRPILNKNLYLYHENRNLARYETYMGTNILIYPVNFDQAKFVHINRITFRNTLHDFFSAWFEQASEHMIWKRASRAVSQIADTRSNFGPLFWTYHMWRRWTVYKRKKKLETVKRMPGYFYLPEWSLYSAALKTRARLKAEADHAYHKNLVHRVAQAMHDEAMQSKVYSQTINDIRRHLKIVAAKRAYRGIKTVFSAKRLHQGTERRVIRAWYQIVDRKHIVRMDYDILTRRLILSTYAKVIRGWRNAIMDEGVGVVLMTSKLLNASSSTLALVYLMRGDHVHYAFITAFNRWHKALKAKKRAQRLIEWSIHYSRLQATQRYLIDCMRANKEKPINRINYAPFKTEQDKSGQIQNPAQSKVSNSSIISGGTKMARNRRRSTTYSHKSISFDMYIPSHTMSSALNAHAKIDQYKPCVFNVAQLTHDQIRTLLFQLITIKAKTAIPKTVQNMISDRETELKQFKLKNMLFNQAALYDMRFNQSNEMKKRVARMKQRHKRDNELILLMEAHDAAVDLNKVEPKFEIFDKAMFPEERAKLYEEEKLKKASKKKKKTKKTKKLPNSPPKTPSAAKKGKKKGKSSKKKEPPKSVEVNNKKKSFWSDEEEEDSSDISLDDLRHVTQKRHLLKPTKSQTSIHPLLQPIEKIKAEALNNTRRFRRDPNDIFTNDYKNRKKFIVHSNLESSSMNLIRQSSVYESFIPISPQLEQKLGAGNINIGVKNLNNFKLGQLETIGEEKEEEEDIPMNLETTKFQKGSKAKFQLTESKTSFGEAKNLPKIIKFGTPTKPIEPIVEDTDFNLSSSDEEIMFQEEETPEPVEKKDERVAEIQGNIHSTISIESLAETFLNNQNFQITKEPNQVGTLTKKYFSILECLLRPPKPKAKRPELKPTPSSGMQAQEFPEFATRITRMLRRIIPPSTPAPTKPKQMTASEIAVKERREKKAKRKGLFDDPDDHFQVVKTDDGKEYQRSNCPEFSNVLFNGHDVLTDTPWEHSGATKLSVKTDSARQLQKLPSATYTHTGFDEILNGEDLKERIAEYLHATKQQEEEEEEDVYEYETDDETGERIRVKKRVVFQKKTVNRTAIDVVDVIARKLVRREAEVDKKEISELVDMDGVTISEAVSETSSTTSSLSTQRTARKTPRRKLYPSHEFYAFDTIPRKKREKMIIEDKFTFTSELVRAIREGSRLTRPVVMTAYPDLNHVKPFEGMEGLRKIVEDRVKSMRRQQEQMRARSSVDPNVPPIVPRPASRANSKFIDEVEVGGGEIALTLGGIGKRDQPKPVRPSSVRVVKKPSTDQGVRDVAIVSRMARTAVDVDTGRPYEEPKPPLTPQRRTQTSYLHITNRPGTPFSSSSMGARSTAARPKTAQTAIVPPRLSIAQAEKNALAITARVAEPKGRRKPIFTKMEATTPFAPETLVFDEPQTPKATAEKRAKPKWALESAPMVSDQDVDFFMFVTPYIMPPELMAKLLEEAE